MKKSLILHFAGTMSLPKLLHKTITACAYLLLLTRCFIFTATARDTVSITRLGIEKGLSNNSVRCIYQDHNGFMWFGTYDGLNRFDGYQFTTFRNSLENTNSLPHNFIYTLQEDAESNLWVGTGQGIAVYDAAHAAFRPAYYLPYPGGKKSRITSNVNALALDKNGVMYIGTNGTGLMVQEPHTQVAKQYAAVIDGKLTTDYNITAIKTDRENKVWMFISPIGLCWFDAVHKKIVPVNRQLSSASCLEADEAGNIWVGSFTGLYIYQPADNTLHRAFEQQHPEWASVSIASLRRCAGGEMWIGTKESGMIIYNTHDQSVWQLRQGETEADLSSEYISAVYEDGAGRKWAGTIKGGINICTPGNAFFQTMAHRPGNPNSLTSNFIATFMEDDDNTLWIGTDGGGLCRWNRAANQFRHYTHNAADAGSLSSNQVCSIVKDYLGDIWVATSGGGINKLSRNSNSFQHYACKSPYYNLENTSVWILHEDTQRTLWAATFGHGYLYTLNRTTNRFETFSPDLIDFLSFYQDKEGKLWGGTAHELILIDRNNKHHIRYETGKPVRSIHEDREGRFWVGTEGGGLLLFDRSSGKVKQRYSVKDGLPNNAILTILEDAQGCLWMSTFNGLSQFCIHQNRFKNYYQEDGLQSNQFLYRAALQLRSGEMLFGGIHGFTLFRPGMAAAPAEKPQLVLTEVEINSQPLAENSRYVTAAKNGQVQSVSIPYNEAMLSVGFAALAYTSPHKINYAYYLDGWDKQWNYSGSGRRAVYTRLQEGDYVLRIKATNADGEWLGQQLTLNVHILPPWYRSWWAYLFYAFLLISGIAGYLRYRSNKARLTYEVALARINVSKERAEREKSEAEYKMQLAEREMERIRAEKEQEINEKRLTFFTNISHEFRTPLSLIINPVRDFVNRTDLKPKDKSALQPVYQNARRLLGLVDQLLLFRKAEAGADRLRIILLDLSAVCREVFMVFEQQAKTQGIQYTFEATAEIMVYADREKLEVILYNLLSNALKYTPAGGTVRVTVNDNTDTAGITVSDSGYGIPAQVGDQLFERFYQVRNKSIPAKAGFGIGLFLVKHFTDAMKGQIRYESKEAQGTSFFITLLKGRAHFEADLIVEEEVTTPTLLEELAAAKPVDTTDKTTLRAAPGLDTLLSERHTMLVVDDDAQITAYLAGFFEPAYTVYTASSAQEGLTLAGQQVPDIIISDVNMEGMNGMAFCAAIKEDASLCHIPVILLTGNEEQQARLEGLQSGADDYITKPFNSDLLSARVANILKSRTTLQKYFFNEITLGKTSYKIAPEYKQFLDNCIAIVEEHIDDPEFGIKMLATELHMSHSSLYKKIKSISGHSASSFVRFIRLRRVAKTLTETEANINEAAMMAGFSDIKHFREQFTRLFGKKPSEYVKAFRKGKGGAYENGPFIS